MKRSNILAAVAAAITFSAGTAFAAPPTTTTTTTTTTADTEQCKVVDKNGVGLIKAGSGQCKSAQHSCAGQNTAGDPNSWISVPKGQCAKINAGDLSGITQDIKDKITAN